MIFSKLNLRDAGGLEKPKMSFHSFIVWNSEAMEGFSKSLRQTAITRNHSQGTKTFYTEQDESSSSDERKPISEEDGKSDPFFEGQKPDTQIKREEKKDG